MGDTTAIDAGKSFRDSLVQAGNGALNTILPARPALQSIVPAVTAAAPSIQDFLSGATGGFVPMSGSPSSSVTVKLPPVTPAKAAAPLPAVAAPAAAKAAVVDPTAGLAGLSFRQLLSLGQLGQTEQRATPKPISAVDQAGNQLASIYQSQFANSLKAAGEDAGKKQAAIDAFEKKMLPIALKGNTADAAIFDGSTPGAQ